MAHDDDNNNNNLALVPATTRSGKKTTNNSSNHHRGQALKRALTAVRFVVRMQMAAREWQKVEHTRRRLADAAEEMLRKERMKKMRAEWKAQMVVKCGEVHV